MLENLSRQACIAIMFAASAIATPVQSSEIDFNRDIQPILTEYCYSCHGPDSESRAADLRLDDRQAAVDGFAIDESDLESSELLVRIFSSDHDVVMPPPESNKSLSETQKDLLQNWILEGAEYDQHWAFKTPSLPTLPDVATHGWGVHPIDAFVLQRLVESGLTPSPEADIRTLIRRVTLDLLGVPPTVEQVQSVLNDDSEDRYERYVDRLLEMKQWGEHRGRFWLDYARYADTHGIHFDNFREMWSYRDWVINAYNQNMPFDQFLTEQLAGDLLPNRTLSQQVATGFNRCNITTNEGGIIDEEYLVLYTRDRTETVSQVFLGLTTGCAVCHDHKYDPISQREFYELAAFFNNSVQGARDGNRKDTPPIVPVPAVEDRERFGEVQKELQELAASIEKRRELGGQEFSDWYPANVKAFNESLRLSNEGLAAHVPLTINSETEIPFAIDGAIDSVPLERQAILREGHVGERAWQNQSELRPTFDEIGDFDLDQSFTVSLWIYVPKGTTNGAVVARMDEANQHRGWDVWLENGRVGTHLIHAWPENALKVVAADPIPVDSWQHVSITYDGTQKAEGLRVFYNGEPKNTNVQKNSLTATTKTDVPFRLGARHTSSPTNGVGLQDIRVFTTAISPEAIAKISRVPRIRFLASLESESASKPHPDLVDHYLAEFDSTFSELHERKNRLTNEKKEMDRRATIAHVYQEKQSEPMAYILHRGEYDQRRDEVQAGTPSALPAMSPDWPRNRLGLAKWLTCEEQPLTARVTVNRYWQEVFGSGLVATAGDFGLAGAPPTHPELLDYLAVSFRNSGWNVKQLFRQIVTSATYKQSAVVSPQKLEVDPQNALLSRGPRFRMDAEMVRDYALQVSGLLAEKIGGPSVRPYQPPGVWEAVAMPGSDTRNYKMDSDENIYRRSMYTFWKRAAPPASMEIFNAPNREVCTVQRERTNTPMQALVTLNDPQFIEAARVLAQQVLTTPLSQDVHRVQWVAERIVGRYFENVELGIIASSLEELRIDFENDPAAAGDLIAIGENSPPSQLSKTELAAWTMLINQLLNLDEVLCK